MSIHQSFGELARSMEKGFGDMNIKFGDMNTNFGDMNTKFAQLETRFESIKSDFRLTKWQSHLMFGGAATVSTSTML